MSCAMDEGLITVRDHLRFAVSEFRREKIVYGHGASTAVDEAAFLILETLSLPIQDINPWLDARLLTDERTRIREVIAARIATRKPAAYLLKKAYIQNLPFYVDERVIVPRSYLGELLLEEDGFALGPDPGSVFSVLDLCTGSGCLAIVAAMAYPDAEIHAIDLSPDALAVAVRNVRDYKLENQITLHQGDLFAPLAKHKFDLIIANPPYVAAEEMAALPEEYAAEPAMALAGGEDGLDIVRRILADAPAHLNAGGGLLCEIGTGREILEDEYPEFDFVWPDTAHSEGEVFWLAKEDFSA